jgi:hypothetical protein
MGLTTARLVQEAGFPVTIYTEALTPTPPRTSPAARFHPFGHFEEEAVTPEWRAQFAAAMDYSWRRFQIMVGDDYGIRWLPTYQQRGSERPAPTQSRRSSGRPLTPAEHPFPVEQIVRYDTLYVETGRYLRQLTRDVQIAGGGSRCADLRLRPRSRPAEKRSSSTAPVSAPASCSATRTCIRSAASSPSCCRSRRCATPSQAGRLHVPARRRDPARRHVRAGRMGRDPATGDDRTHPRLAQGVVRRVPMYFGTTRPAAPPPPLRARPAPPPRRTGADCRRRKDRPRPWPRDDRGRHRRRPDPTGDGECPGFAEAR